MPGLWEEENANKEPAWVAEVIARLEAQGYTVTCTYDGDGSSWQNKLYTVTKDNGSSVITYRQNVRAQQLLTL